MAKTGKNCLKMVKNSTLQVKCRKAIEKMIRKEKRVSSFWPCLYKK